MPVKRVEVSGVPVVVAAKAIPVGVRITKDDVKVVEWPASNQVPGAYADPKAVLDLGVIQTIAVNEPVTATKVASPESGAGLPPIIPAGMRAMSVRVNDVVGVAGYVLPGTRVDVLVSVRDDGGQGNNEPMARTVVSNVEVLTSGINLNREDAKKGDAQKVSVVTLAVLPDDAERIALATSQGTISLALRNPLDVEPTKTAGIKLPALMRGGAAPEPVVIEATPKQPRRVVPRVVAAPAPPPAPPAQTVYKVETIRAAKRSEEVID
jgi:pilus assembly protein CpaB